VGIVPAEIQNTSNSPGLICVSPVAVHVTVSTTWLMLAPSASIGVSNVRVVVLISQPCFGCTDTKAIG
jgi:hypothetical protein